MNHKLKNSKERAFLQAKEIQTFFDSQKIENQKDEPDYFDRISQKNVKSEFNLFW